MDPMGNDQVPKQGFHGMSYSGGWDSKLPTPVTPHHCHGGLGALLPSGRRLRLENEH
jgi:hypothetical protein